jgi:hypothetical protein
MSHDESHDRAWLRDVKQSQLHDVDILVSCCCRYVSREAYEGTHRTSPAFLNFKAAMAALPFKVELVGQSFLETNIGFML